jgi:hypothetical protein
LGNGYFRIYARRLILSSGWDLEEGIKMDSKSFNGLTLYFDREERESAEIIEKACRKSIQTIDESWGLKPPQDCRVYVLTSWPRCVFQGAPPKYQFMLALTLPIWYSEFKQRWKYAGGWAQRYGDRQVVGIKTLHLIEHASESMGESIFIKQDSLEENVLSITCHELTHAYTSHLSLPIWLHEGLAMVTVDHCLQKETVKRDTLDILHTTSEEVQNSEKIDLRAQSKEDIINLYVRGYWVTRFLAETQPKLLRSCLGKRYSSQELEEKIAAGYGVAPEVVWSEIDSQVVNYFEEAMTDEVRLGN